LDRLEIGGGEKPFGGGWGSGPAAFSGSDDGRNDRFHWKFANANGFGKDQSETGGNQPSALMIAIEVAGASDATAEHHPGWFPLV